MTDQGKAMGNELDREMCAAAWRGGYDAGWKDAARCGDVAIPRYAENPYAKPTHEPGEPVDWKGPALPKGAGRAVPAETAGETDHDRLQHQLRIAETAARGHLLTIEKLQSALTRAEGRVRELTDVLQVCDSLMTEALMVMGAHDKTGRHPEFSETCRRLSSYLLTVANGLRAQPPLASSVVADEATTGGQAQAREAQARAQANSGRIGPMIEFTFMGRRYALMVQRLNGAGERCGHPTPATPADLNEAGYQAFTRPAEPRGCGQLATAVAAFLSQRSDSGYLPSAVFDTTGIEQALGREVTPSAGGSGEGVCLVTRTPARQ